MRIRILTTQLVVAAMLGGITGLAAADPPIARISINAVAALSHDRLNITVSGSCTCGPLPQPQPPYLGASFASVSGSVDQASGREVIQGQLFFEPNCDGLEHTFEVAVPASITPWHGGLARVRAMITVQRCDPFFDCEQATGTVDAQIKVRGGQE